MSITIGPGGFFSSGLEEPDYEQRGVVQRVKPGAAGLEGALFVEGFSMCGVEFHLQNLFKERWPAGCAMHLTTWQPDHPERLSALLDANRFQLIVLAAKTGDWKYEYQDSKAQYRRLKPKLDALDASLKAAVERKGATLVLFCAEMASAIYQGLFGRPWEEGCYVRTSCFRTSAAAAVLPAGAPAEINAKSIHLKHVPESEAWYATTPGSANNSLLERPDLQPGLASIAAGAAGAGRVVFCGDVNAESGTCRVVAQLAHAMFGGRPRPAQPQPQQPLGPCCAACGACGEGTQLLRCARCQSVVYCSKACQRDDWSTHKRSCGR
ncbi:hypothetical protein COHA_007989 [Chlorella ohadii]|uniref:MYND-type domain-containing protein n=1 Tax=Chlorella ohadii TaxID=2649997 RepID=A0AAD5DPS4_9CHLO|nr:hypothetical protein COHA_007989 [Chlorella ohadii]